MTGESERQIGNWGKWGEKDERGALNYVTPEVIRKAGRLVRQGKVYSLALQWEKTPVPEDRGRPIHLMSCDGGDFAAGARRVGGSEHSDDFIIMATHSVTHVDALCHAWYDDLIYNGFSGNTVRSRGAKYCGVDKIGWMFTRGILLDLPAYKGVGHLEKSYIITPQDLDGCALAEGVSVETGDAVLIRTGWLNTCQEYAASDPGIGMEVADWVKAKQICAIASDNAGIEVRPPENKDKWMPVHEELIRNQGVFLIELLNLDELARDKVYQFLFVVAPLPIPGGTGSPINPLAIT